MALHGVLEDLLVELHRVLGVEPRGFGYLSDPGQDGLLALSVPNRFGGRALERCDFSDQVVAKRQRLDDVVVDLVELVAEALEFLAHGGLAVASGQNGLTKGTMEDAARCVKRVRPTGGALQTVGVASSRANRLKSRRLIAGMERR